MRLFSCPYLFRRALLGCLSTALLVASCATPNAPTSTASPEPRPTETPAPTEPPTPVPSPTPEPTLTHAEQAANLTSEITERITFATVGDRDTDLDVHVPEGAGPWPVVIVAHGIQQDRRLYGELSEAISAQGAVVYNVDLDITFPFITAMQRAACAVRFARETAEVYGGDPNQIIFVGNSGGALSGAVVALSVDALNEDCVIPDQSAELQGLVGYEGPYSIATYADSPAVDHTVFEEEDLEIWHAIDPYHHIGGNPDVRIRLVHGNDVDRLWFEVRPEISMRFHQALVDAGYDVELIMIDEADHTDLSNPELEAFAVVLQQILELMQGTSR